LKRPLIFGIVWILSVQGLSAASTLSDFGTQQKEAMASLRHPACWDIINITLPAECHVLNATMNISTVAPDGDFPGGPTNATVLLDDTTVYSFNGNGYGAFGKQSTFESGNSTFKFEFGSGGRSADTKIRLPKSAHVDSASMDVTCQGPERMFELWNKTGDPGDWMDIAEGVGDVNNDTYDDFAVCAPYNDTYGTDAGVVYLFYGNSALDYTPDLEFHNNQNDTGFGTPQGVGDLNGDGYDDIAIGSLSDNIGTYGAGAVYVYYGGDPMDNEPDLILKGDHYFQFFGYSISGECDLNNDGFDDLVFTFQMGWYPPEHGMVTVIFGSKTMDSAPDLIIEGPEAIDYFGILANDASDLNADGYDDLIIAAQGSWEPGNPLGRVYIYYGGEDMDNISDMILSDDLTDHVFGNTANGGGDINGDGYEDMVISSSENIPRFPESLGKIYCYFGGPSFDNQTDLTINCSRYNDGFGWVGIAGDVNDDGFDDIVVCCFNDSTNGNNSGAWFLYFGGTDMDTIPDYSCYGNPGDFLALGPASIGDVNKDGHDEFMISAWANETTHNGRVIIYFDWKSGLLNSSLDVAAERIWHEEGYFNRTGTIDDFSDTLNTYLEKSIASINDPFGNQFVEIPFDAGSQCDGTFIISNLSIIYSYKTPTLEFSDALNEYIIEHKNEKDPNGNIIIPIMLVSESPGRLKLCDLRLELDEAARLVENIPDIVMDEDTIVTDLIDFQKYFKDDLDQISNLRFEVDSFTNNTIVNVSIGNNHYLAIDALNGTQNDNWTGTIDIVVKCFDSWNSTARSNNFVVTVQNVPDPPVFTSMPTPNGTAGTRYAYQAVAVDGDMDPLAYSLSQKPPDMTIDPNRGLVEWVPKAGGTYPVSLNVSDGRFSVSQNFSILVPNQLPMITSLPNTTAITTLPYGYTVNASDADGDPLEYSLVSEIPGMSIDPMNGTISWTPQNAGDFTVKIKVADANGGEAFQEFQVRVYKKVEPKMEYVSLPEQAKVEGTVTVSGRILNGSLDVVSVQYQLDSGEWVNLSTTENWTLDLDTTKLKNGNHVLKVRVYDGQEYVEVTTRSFRVNNPVKTASDAGTVFVVVLTLGLVATAGGLFLWKGKRPPDEEE